MSAENSEPSLHFPLEDALFYSRKDKESGK